VTVAGSPPRVGDAAGRSTWLASPACLLLAFEQSLVRATDLSRVKMAFDVNGGRYPVLRHDSCRDLCPLSITPLAPIHRGHHGASGALYAVRTVAALLEQGCELDLVVSDYGRRLLVDELGKEAALERLMRTSNRSTAPASPGAASRCSATGTSAPPSPAAAADEGMVIVRAR